MALQSKPEDRNRKAKAAPRASKPTKSKTGAGVAAVATAAALVVNRQFIIEGSEIIPQWQNDKRWIQSFLPTLMHMLYISHEPFKHFKPTSAEFHQIVQTAFDLAYSNVDHELDEDDTVISDVSYCPAE